MRLLLVDDDDAFTHVLSRILRRRGLTVTVAATAADALQYLAESVPDCAVLDMKLEQSSGLELIRPLRDASETMRIVVLTGYASIPTTVEAIKRGADNYLAKPIDADTLLAALAGDDTAEPSVPDQPLSLRRLEWEHIQRVLDEHAGNISATARALGMHRRSLQRKLLKRPAKR